LGRYRPWLRWGSPHSSLAYCPSELRKEL
jgi:hypothetical protein